MTTEPLVYEVDGATFLDRMRRSRAMQDELRSGKSVDVGEWSQRMRAILREVDPLPLVIGVRYRMRVFGAGDLSFEHKHYQDDSGAVHGIDLPTMSGASILEVEGVYLGRHPDGPWRGLIALDIGGMTTSALADTDVLRCEEIR